MNRFFKSLSARLALWYATIFVFFSATAILILYLSIDNILREEIDDDLEEDVMEMRGYMNEGGVNTVIHEIRREISTDDPDEVFLRLIDNDGKIIFSTETISWKHLTDKLELRRDIQSNDDFLYTTFLHLEDEYHARMISARLDNNLIIQIGESTEDAEEFMHLILIIFIITYVLVTIMSVFVGWYIAKKALSGVTAVSNAAAEVADGSLDIRVSIKPQGEEVEKLVSAFNIMLDRIRDLIIGMREMTDNIAHDLRSQLGRIRANAEMSLSDTMTLDEHKTLATDTLEECDRLVQLINTTLDVSEVETGASQISMQQVNISDIVNDAYELFEPIAEERGIALCLNVEPDCYLNGHTQYLQRMLANFIDNGLKYTRQEGKVEVKLSSDKGDILITIRDDGLGIEKNNQQRIFERFFRCDTSRTTGGNGLGLSFARAVILAHGGSITLSSSIDEGSVFTIRLPS